MTTSISTTSLDAITSLLSSTAENVKKLVPVDYDAESERSNKLDHAVSETLDRIVSKFKKLAPLSY